jgi:hypothetical protein
MVYAWSYRSHHASVRRRRASAVRDTLGAEGEVYDDCVFGSNAGQDGFQAALIFEDGVRISSAETFPDKRDAIAAAAMKLLAMPDRLNRLGTGVQAGWATPAI